LSAKPKAPEAPAPVDFAQMIGSLAKMPELAGIAAEAKEFEEMVAEDFKVVNANLKVLNTKLDKILALATVGAAGEVHP
jgi:hypothetical protein